MERIREVPAFVIEKDNTIVIHFRQFAKLDFKKFVEINGFQSKRIVFVPEPPKKAKEMLLKIPCLTRYELLKETLKKQGLI